MNIHVHWIYLHIFSPHNPTIYKNIDQKKPCHPKRATGLIYEAPMHIDFTHKATTL